MKLFKYDVCKSWTTWDRYDREEHDCCYYNGYVFADTKASAREKLKARYPETPHDKISISLTETDIIELPSIR